jgi:zinc-ribbon domain
MTCTHCGTDISDKALVCYRCGHATSEPRVRPGEAPGRPGRIPVIAALLILVLGALFMAQAAVGTAPRIVSWVVAGLAAIVIVWRLWRGRG